MSTAESRASYDSPDPAAAEALAGLYPGADVVRQPFASPIPGSAKTGRKRVHANDAARNAYRDR
jgi:hypothetical protein